MKKLFAVCLAALLLSSCGRAASAESAGEEPLPPAGSSEAEIPCENDAGFRYFVK